MEQAELKPTAVDFEDGEREPRPRPPECLSESRTVTETVSPRYLPERSTVTGIFPQ